MIEYIKKQIQKLKDLLKNKQYDSGYKYAEYNLRQHGHKAYHYLMNSIDAQLDITEFDKGVIKACEDWCN